MWPSEHDVSEYPKMELDVFCFPPLICLSRDELWKNQSLFFNGVVFETCHEIRAPYSTLCFNSIEFFSEVVDYAVLFFNRYSNKYK